MPYAPEHCNSSGVAERDLVKPDPLWQRATESQESKRSWKYFLTLIKFSHVPYGCGASASASPPSLKGHLLLSFCVSLSLSLFASGLVCTKLLLLHRFRAHHVALDPLLGAHGNDASELQSKIEQHG